MALGSWLSQAWHAAGGPIAAAAAVAAGQPQLAAAAYAAGSAASAKKPSQPTPAVVQAPVAVGPGQGFVAAYDSLPPIDRNIIMVAGAAVGVALVAKLIAPRGRR